MKSHVGWSKAVANPEVARSSMRDAPVRLGVAKACHEGVVQRVIDERDSQAAVLVFRPHRDSTDVQGVVERSTTRSEWKRQALGDAVARVLYDVVVDLAVLERFEQLFGARRVLQGDRETRTMLLRLVEDSIELDGELKIVEGAAAKRVARFQLVRPLLSE